MPMTTRTTTPRHRQRRLNLSREAANMVMTVLRDYKRIRHELVEGRADIVEGGMGMGFDARSSGGGPSDPTGDRAITLAAHRRLTELGRQVRAVDVVLETLPADWKPLIPLWYWEHRTPDQVAKALGVERTTVYVRHNRIVETIAEQLGWR